jgi:hypothetical protein
VDRLLLRALLARGSHHCALFVRQTPIGCCVSDTVLQQSEVLKILQQRAVEKDVLLYIVDVDGRIQELVLQPDAQQENACLAITLTNI